MSPVTGWGREGSRELGVEDTRGRPVSGGGCDSPGEYSRLQGEWQEEESGKATTGEEW